MLRIIIDLSACIGQEKEPFWRLERTGIHNRCIGDYALMLLKEYGIHGVAPLTYLDGTLLPAKELPQILQNGDVLSIVPSSQPIKPMVGIHRPPFGPAIISNDVEICDSSSGSSNFENVAARPSGNNPSTSISVSSEEPESRGAVGTPHSPGPVGYVGKNFTQKKRKRGKRASRTRSKQVKFRVIEEVNKASTNMLENNDRKTVESSPEKKDKTPRADSESPGVSQQSKKPMKKKCLRKALLLRSGLGHYLSAWSDISPANPTEARETFQQADLSTIEEGDEDKDGTKCCSVLDSNHVINCDVGVFDTETSEVRVFSGQTLQIIENNKEKKMMNVRLLEGDLPSCTKGETFSVSWGMVSYPKIVNSDNS